MKNLRKFTFLLIFLGLALTIPPLWIYTDPETSAASKDEILDAHVRIDVEWNNYNPENGNISQTGSFFVEVRGTIIRVPDNDPFFYTPKNLVANYQYQDRGIYVGYSHGCPQLYSEEKGSGAVRILTSDEVEDPTKNGVFELGASAGWEQSLSLLKDLQSKGRTPGRRKPAFKEPKIDIYNFVLTVPMATTLTEQSSPCSRYKTSPWSRGVALAPYLNLTKRGMAGSYSWTSNTLDTGLQIRDYPNQTQFEPQKGEGNVNYRVSWNFGKIKPIVKIWRQYKDRKPEDITDAKPMKVPVIVGEKIILEAEILPHDMEITNGKWKIDDLEIDDTKGEIITGYECDDKKGKVLTLSKEDTKKKKIEFYWVDGNFAGTPRKVTFTADSEKGEVKGETIITVFKPNVTTKERIPSKEITVGPWENSCRLYLGKLKITKPPEGKPGILISHEIKMPMQFSSQPHLLQYVQLIKEEQLEHHNIDYFQRANKEWCLDTHCPYKKMIPTPSKVEINDSPGYDLGLATKEVHIRDQFETYLMFIPSGNPQDMNSVWIPLKVVEWGWGVAVKRTVDWRENPPCDKNTFKFLYGYYSNPTEKDCKKHPEWPCNVTENQRNRINEDTWEKLKAARANKP